MSATLADVAFTGALVEWRGPAPFFFVAVPEEHVAAIRDAARLASYGWGCVPVEVRVNGALFTTSLFPKDGGYMVPLKAKVRSEVGVSYGEEVQVELTVRTR